MIHQIASAENKVYALGTDGRVYVCDAGNHRVQRYLSDGSFDVAWGSFGSDPGQFNIPTDVAVDDAGHIYVLDKDNQRVQRFVDAAVPALDTSWGAIKADYRR